MFRKILYPTDFSESSYTAIKRFASINKMDVGSVVILHVVDETHLEDLMNGYSFLYNSQEVEISDIEEKLKKYARRKLENVKMVIREHINPAEIKLMVRFGIPYDEIVKVAEEEDVSLILLPSHGKRGYSHEIFGSTSIRVLRKTRRPVLIIKAWEE